MRILFVLAFGFCVALISPVAAQENSLKEVVAQKKCMQEFRHKYEYSSTDKYGNTTRQRFERLLFSYKLADHQTSYFGYGNHSVLSFVMIMFKNGSMVSGKLQGYCVIRRGTYLNGNQIIDVEIKAK